MSYRGIEGLLPHEKQTGKTQVGRPLLLGLLLVVLAALAMLVLSLTAMLVGPAFGPLVLAATLLLTVRGEQYDVEGGLVAFSWRRRAMTEAVTVRSEVWIALGIGVLYTLLGLVVDWPLSFQVDMVNNLLWIGYWNGGDAISLTWLWWLAPLLFAVDVAFPFVFRAIWQRFMLEIRWPNFADSVTAVRGKARSDLGVPITYDSTSEPVDAVPFGADDTPILIK